MADIAALQTATLGVQRGMNGLRKNAAEIASKDQMSRSDPEGLARPLVEMLENRNQVQASAQALRRVDEALGSLLDVKA